MRNPWPIGLAVFISACAATMAGFVVFSTRHRTDLVSPDYYAREIAYQQHIDREQRADGLSAAEVIRYDHATRSLLVALPADRASLVSEGAVELYRPADAGRDRRTPLALGADGRQSIPAADLARGLWRVRLGWTEAGRACALEGTVMIP